MEGVSKKGKRWSRFYLQDAVEDEEFHEEEIPVSWSLVHVDNGSLGGQTLKAHSHGVCGFQLKTFKLQIWVSKVVDVAGICEAGNVENRGIIWTTVGKKKHTHNERGAQVLLGHGSQSTAEDAEPPTASMFSRSLSRDDQLSARLQG